jgi:DNA polymerase III alpha subunit (gram-positive type)
MEVSANRMQQERMDFLRKVKQESLFLVYGLATTGLDVVSDRIVQIVVRACMVTDGGITELSKRSWYINPGCAMPEQAFKIHGISDEFLKDKPSEAEVFKEVSEYISDYPVCGYNNHNFGDPLMGGMYKRNGAEFNPRVSIDLYPVTNFVLDASQVPNHRLNTVATYWGFGRHGEFSNAEDDTMAAELILDKLVNALKLIPEFESPRKDAIKVDVASVSYWSGRGNVRPRIYVAGTAGEEKVKFWVDPKTGAYNNADKTGPNVSTYDVDDMERQVLERIKCDYKEFTGKA